MTLIDSLSKLDAPDREVDAEIDVLFFGGETVWKTANYTMEQFPTSKRDSKNHICGYAYEHVPAYTASVDAAIALAERVLPFTHMVSTYHDDVACSVEIHCCPEGLSGEWKFDVKGDHEHLAVAYCIAILRAVALLRAKEASNGQ